MTDVYMCVMNAHFGISRALTGLSKEEISYSLCHIFLFVVFKNKFMNRI